MQFISSSALRSSLFTFYYFVRQFEAFQCYFLHPCVRRSYECTCCIDCTNKERLNVTEKIEIYISWAHVLWRWECTHIEWWRDFSSYFLWLPLALTFQIKIAEWRWYLMGLYVIYYFNPFKFLYWNAMENETENFRNSMKNGTYIIGFLFVIKII